MLVRTLLLSLAIVLVSIAAAQAADQIPVQYRGFWCATKPPNIFQRCREANGEDSMWISARDFLDSMEWSCKPLAITAVPGGHKVRAVCRQDYAPSKKAKPQVERWRLSPNGRRLEVRTD